MYTSFTDWGQSSCIQHYGVPHMHWNSRRYQYSDGSLTPLGREHYGVGKPRVRKRYQNEDGSLTKAGMAKIAKHNTGYLAPNRKDMNKRSWKKSERNKVRSERDSKYWDAVSKGMKTSEPSKKDQQLWDGYKDKYAKAMLKDAKLQDTKAARRQIKKYLKDIDYMYNYSSRRKVDEGVVDTRESYRMYKEGQKKREQLIHYKREKIKKGYELVKKYITG